MQETLQTEPLQLATSERQEVSEIPTVSRRNKLELGGR